MLKASTKKIIELMRTEPENWCFTEYRAIHVKTGLELWRGLFLSGCMNNNTVPWSGNLYEHFIICREIRKLRDRVALLKLEQKNDD